MKKSISVLCALVLTTGMTLASNVTWTGTNMTWTHPDSDSFDIQYNDDDTVQFTGNWPGTVTVDAGGVNPAGVSVSGGTYTLDGGSIGGSGALSKGGSGTLTLRGTNTYSGGTTIGAGIVDIIVNQNLGSPGTPISFTGSAELMNSAGGTVDLGSRAISVNSGQIATFWVGRGRRIHAYGPVTGDGGVAIQVNGGASPKVYLFSTANTFTGPIQVRSGSDNPSLYMNSIADGSGAITLYTGSAHLYYHSGAITPLTLNTRPIVVAGGGYINNDSGYPMTINSSVTASGVGSYTLNFWNGSGSINCNIDEGTATLGLGFYGTWSTSGTNTYSGMTYVSSGTLTMQGEHAIPTNTVIRLKKWTTIKLLTDQAGRVNIGNELEVETFDTSSGVLDAFTVHVGNSGGSTTNSTIVLGKVDFQGGGGQSAPTRQIRTTGANGYRVEFGDVDMRWDSASTRSDGNQGFYPISAPITITGTIKQLDGNTGNTTANQLYLGGTIDGNDVSGVIANPDDYPGNANAQPLRIVKGDTCDWTLSGTNTYTGTTTIRQGVMRVAGALHVNSAVTVTNNGAAAGFLSGTGTVGSVALTGIGAIRLLDNIVGTLTLDGDLAINGAADANGLYFDLGTAGNGTDKITVSGNVTVTTPGAAVIYLNQLTGTKINAGTYNLIEASGTMAAVGNFTLATTSAFGNNFALQLDGTSKILQLVVTSAAGAPAEAFWTGGGVDNNWSSLTNWATDITGATPIGAAPGYDTDVKFNVLGAARLTSGTIDSDFDIDSITYLTNAIANTTIASSGGSLILEASSGTGIVVKTAVGSPSHTISAPISLANSQIWAVESNSSLTVDSVISDFAVGHSLTKEGDGLLYVSGLNDYQGATVINGGTLQIWHYSLANSTAPNALGMSSADPGNLVLGSGATLEFLISGDAVKATDRGFTINGSTNGATATIRTEKYGGQGYKGVQFTGTASPAYGTPNQTRTLILDGSQASGGGNYNNNTRLHANIADNGSGAVSLVKNGVGSWQLRGNSSFSGGVTLNQGSLRISSSDNCLGSGTLTMAGGVLTVDDDRSIPGGIQLDADGRISVPSGTRTLAVGGAITGTGNLIVDGSGTVALQGVGSTHSGNMIVSNGTLRLTFDDALPTFAKLYLQTNGTTGVVALDFTGKQQIGKLYFDGIQQPSGIYTADGTYITGTGILSVGSLGTVLIIK